MHLAAAATCGGGRTYHISVVPSRVPEEEDSAIECQLRKESGASEGGTEHSRSCRFVREGKGVGVELEVSGLSKEAWVYV